MTKYELVVSDKDLVVDHIALRFVRYIQCVIGNRYVLLGAANDSWSERVSESQPITHEPIGSHT